MTPSVVIPVSRLDHLSAVRAIGKLIDVALVVDSKLRRPINSENLDMVGIEHKK